MSDRAMHSQGLINKLDELGLLPDNCQRMIIDISYDNVVKTYYQCLGDTRLLDVDLLNEIRITINEQKKEEDKVKE